MATRGPAINQMPWGQMFRSVSAASLAYALAGGLLACWLTGGHGLGAFLLGLVLVYTSFLVSVCLVMLGERKSLTRAAQALLASYPLKIFFFTLLLVFLPLPDAFRNGWMLAGSLGALLLQLILEIKIVTKQRILYFDSVG